MPRHCFRSRCSTCPQPCDQRTPLLPCDQHTPCPCAQPRSHYNSAPFVSHRAINTRLARAPSHTPIITAPLLCHTGAASGFEMCFGPSTLGAGDPKCASNPVSVIKRVAHHTLIHNLIHNLMSRWVHRHWHAPVTCFNFQACAASPARTMAYVPVASPQVTWGCTVPAY